MFFSSSYRNSHKVKKSDTIQSIRKHSTVIIRVELVLGSGGKVTSIALDDVGVSEFLLLLCLELIIKDKVFELSGFSEHLGSGRSKITSYISKNKQYSIVEIKNRKNFPICKKIEILYKF
ncbi:MAG: hypothetical protein LBG59_07955 [Candidatus Peribacteria bacterium]|jgi:hypothetical protein|nr:hypothetical protein [Candidatus Peribacteria bacterium]